MATFHFELVSPDKMLFSGEAQAVLVPGADGDFHGAQRPRAGDDRGQAGRRRRSTTPRASTQRVFVRGGFADVEPDAA